MCNPVRIKILWTKWEVRSAPQAVEKSHGIFIEAHGWATGIRWSHRLYESIFKSQQTTDSHFSWYEVLAHILVIPPIYFWVWHTLLWWLHNLGVLQDSVLLTFGGLSPSFIRDIPHFLSHIPYFLAVSPNFVVYAIYASSSFWTWLKASLHRFQLVFRHMSQQLPGTEMEAPSLMLVPADYSEVSLGCKNLKMCHLQFSSILRAIFKFDTAIMQAVCPFLPARELRALSVLMRSFRSASTLAWSEDILENERVLLAIAQKDQPQFLAKAIADSGICKASLGRLLLRATTGGRENRSHRCCKLLGELGAVIRLEDAFMVTGGEPGYHDGVYVRAECEEQESARYIGDDCCVERVPASFLDYFQEELRISGLQSGPHANWKEPLWIFVHDGGFIVAYLAFSASTVPLALGWHPIYRFCHLIGGNGSQTMFLNCKRGKCNWQICLIQGPRLQDPSSWRKTDMLKVTCHQFE